MMTRLSAGLAVRAALWGVALGGLAPVTTALVLTSGLAAPGVTPVEVVDPLFFLVYLPVAMGLSAALLALHDDYRRTLTAAVAVLGVITLVKLRVHGGEVTDSEAHDAWYLVNGSLVLHAIATWALLRWAVRDLTRSALALPTDRSVADGLATQRSVGIDPISLAGLGLQALVWGVMIGAVAGGAVGSVMFPLLGTVAGAYLGALFGLAPTIVGSLLLVAVVACRRPDDVAGLHRTVGGTLAVVGVGALVWVVPILGEVTVAEGWDLVSLWLLALVTVYSLLRSATDRLVVSYERSTLARRERAVLTA